MEKVAVIGAGLIGRGWAIVFARAGRPVALTDADPGALGRGMELLRENLEDLAGFGLIDEAPEAVAARVTATEDLGEALSGCDYAQECVLEKVDLKAQVFAEMDRLAPEGAILASSASFSPVSDFASDLPGRHRCLVAHPVNPPHLVPVVEIVPAPFTDPDAVERARRLMAEVGQAPIVVEREVFGFVLNRLQAALLNEAFRLVEDGLVSPADLDVTVKHGLGLRWVFMGPFETIDLNAPGGIADYAERARAAMLRMAEEQADPRPWAPGLVEKIEAARRQELAADGLQAKQDWRDRRLMALLAQKRKAAAREPG